MYRSSTAVKLAGAPCVYVSRSSVRRAKSKPTVIYTYIYISRYTHCRTHPFLYPHLYICVYVRINACVCIYIYTNMYIDKCLCIRQMCIVMIPAHTYIHIDSVKRVYTYLQTLGNVRIYTSLSIYICMCVYMCVHSCMYKFSWLYIGRYVYTT